MRNGDYIVVVVNQELVTAGEIDRRVQRARETPRRGVKPAAESELRAPGRSTR